MKMLIQKVTIYNLFSQAEINVNKIMFDNSVQVKMIENNIQIIFLSMLLLKVK
jgi:hypothetical protein